MSYGKVDHDRFGLLVALAVLPTAGRARHGDTTRTEAGGWALRVTQIAVICTYFLAAFAKLRFGGLDWLTGSVLARAIIRRGTDLADLIAQVPYLLIVAQFGIVAFELLSPVVFFLPPRWRHAMVGFFYSFHAGHHRDHHDLVRAAPGRDDQLPAAGAGPPAGLGPPTHRPRRPAPTSTEPRRAAGPGSASAPARTPAPARRSGPGGRAPRRPVEPFPGLLRQCAGRRAARQRCRLRATQRYTGQAAARTGGNRRPAPATRQSRATRRRAASRWRPDRPRVAVRADPLHRLLALGHRQAERVQVGELPGHHPRTGGDPALDELGALVQNAQSPS